MDAITPELAGEDESAHTSGRKSARNPRIEVLVRADRRRSWTTAEKQEIVAESLGPDLTPADVARKHGISTGQLYTWRRQMLSRQSAVSTRPGPRFAPVEVSVPEAISAAGSVLTVTNGSQTPIRPDGLIEIVLPSGVSVRVDGHVDGRALRRVLGALEGR